MIEHDRAGPPTPRYEQVCSGCGDLLIPGENHFCNITIHNLVARQSGPPTPRYTLREREEMAAREAGFDDPGPEPQRPANWPWFLVIALLMVALLVAVLLLNGHFR